MGTPERKNRNRGYRQSNVWNDAIELYRLTCGVFRGFPSQGVGASARTGEILSATLSAAVRNVLLYRSLLEAIDEVADARREAGNGFGQ